LLLRLRLHRRRLRLPLHCGHWLQLLQPSFLQLLQLQQLRCHHHGDDASYASYEPLRPADLLLQQ
jgi:hypothetical protein